MELVWQVCSIIDFQGFKNVIISIMYGVQFGIGIMCLAYVMHNNQSHQI